MCFGAVLISSADGFAFTQKHTSSLISKSYATTTNRQKYFSSTRRNFSFSLSSSSSTLDEFTSNVEPKNTLPPQTPTTDSIGASTSPRYEKDTLERFAKDVAIVLKVMCAAEQDPDIPDVWKSKKLSFTSIWTPEMWKEHASRWRFWRYIKSFPTSRLLRRMAPQLSAYISWCIVVVLFHGRFRFDMPLTSLSLVSTFVGLLLTSRSNQGINRLSDGRFAWGRCVRLSRDTANLFVTYVYPKDKELGLLSARLLSTFGFLMKAHLRGKDANDIVSTMLPQKIDASYILSQRKKPVAVVFRLRQIVANMAERGLLAVPQHQALENNLHELNHVYGMCERLRGSSIPPVYTSHTSRLMLFYLFFLPIALVATQLNRVMTVLVSGAVGFAMLGFDEITFILENPFALMPLYQQSKNIMLDVADAFTCQPPHLKSQFLKIKAEPLNDDREENIEYPYGTSWEEKPIYW